MTHPFNLANEEIGRLRKALKDQSDEIDRLRKALSEAEDRRESSEMLKFKRPVDGVHASKCGRARIWRSRPGGLWVSMVDSQELGKFDSPTLREAKRRSSRKVAEREKR